jgi:hypothetical protein
MSDQAAGQKPRSLEGCDENGPAAHFDRNATIPVTDLVH